MPYFKFLIIFIILFISSCTDNIQKNGLSIQEVIQKALKKIVKKKIIIFGSGRTDSGVHAIEQSAHFEIKKKIQNLNKFLKSINYFVNNESISILKIKKLRRNLFFLLLICL